MKAYLTDALERVIATFAETFLASLILVLAAGKDLDKAALSAAAVAGLASALTVAKVALAKFVGDPDSAAMVEGESE